MQVINTGLDDTIQEIKDLETEMKLLESKYSSLLEAEELSEISREIQIKIRHLKIELKAKQESLRIYPII